MGKRLPIVCGFWIILLFASACDVELTVVDPAVLQTQAVAGERTRVAQSVDTDSVIQAPDTEPTDSVIQAPPTDEPPTQTEPAETATMRTDEIVATVSEGLTQTAVISENVEPQDITTEAPAIDSPTNTPPPTSRPLINTSQTAVLLLNANGRECPELSCTATVILRKGRELTIVGEVRGDVVAGSDIWRIALVDGQEVYIHNSVLDNFANVQPTPFQAIIQANARDCPRLDCDVVTIIEGGSEVNVLGDVAGDEVNGSTLWRVIELGDTRAFVHSSVLSDGSTTSRLLITDMPSVEESPEPTSESIIVQIPTITPDGVSISTEVAPTDEPLILVPSEETQVVPTEEILIIAPTETNPDDSIMEYVLSFNTNARTCPELDCEILFMIPAGTFFDAYAEERGDPVAGSAVWLVSEINGQDVYVHSSQLEPRDPSTSLPEPTEDSSLQINPTATSSLSITIPDSTTTKMPTITATVGSIFDLPTVDSTRALPTNDSPFGQNTEIAPTEEPITVNPTSPVSLTQIAPPITYYAIATADVYECPEVECSIVSTIDEGEAISVYGEVIGELRFGSTMWMVADVMGKQVFIPSAILSEEAP